MKFIEQKIADTLEQNYMPYAMSVIVSRAIPEIDGFKPSHRKLLYTMYKMGLLGSARTKSANVVGQTMKLNPHGDMAIYETLVRLTKGNAALLHPIIDSKGNFGKQYSRDMKFAAPRYTEVKLDKLSEEIFRDIDKDTVDFIDNYDGTMKEPVLLPATFPNILVNPNQGIAVGMASNICSFNLKEICEATIALMENENAEMRSYIKAPDFSTGGKIIYKEKELNEIYNSGRGGFKVRSKYLFDKSNSCIEVTEIPYTTTAEAIIDAIVELVKEGKIKEISDVRDETDLDGLKITIDIKKSADPDALMNKLYKLTPLEDSFNCNFNILINGKPAVMGVKKILTEWIIFRVNCIRRQTNFDITRKKEKLHLLIGLKALLLDIDKAIKIIRETDKEVNVVPNLIEGFTIDKLQAESIAEIKLRNLNREYILNRVAETENLEKDIKDLEILVGSDPKIRKLISKQLTDIAKKLGQHRKTEIINEEHVEEITDEHMIEDFNLNLFLTEHGYLKKIPLTSLRSNPEQKLKDDDKIIQELDFRNKADLMLFTTTGEVCKIKIHELDEHKAGTLGEYLPNYLGLAEGESIVYMAATDDYSGYMLFFFENGKGAKIDMLSYETKTNRKRLANAYNIESKLVRMMFITEDIELAAKSNIGKLLVFNTAGINSKTTRNSQGVQVLKSKNGSTMISVSLLDELSLSDPEYYKTENIPAIGCYIKEEDRGEKQLPLWTENNKK